MVQTRAEGALDRASEGDLRALAGEANSMLPWFAASPDPWIVTDREGRIAALHPGATTVPWPEITENILDVVLEVGHDVVRAATHAATAEGEARRLDVAMRRSDGSPVSFETTILPVDLSGARGLLWTLKDVTEKRREEKRLRLADSLMTDTQGVAHLGIWDWDPSEPHATWSPQLHQIYGTDPRTHVPSFEDYVQRVHPEDRERVIRATEGVFNDHRAYSHDERIVRTDGSIRWLHTWAEAVKDEEGRVVRLVGVCQDITDRKLAELGIEARLREKEVLLREVHHRVKNNLQVIASLIDLQSRATQSPELRGSLQEARDRVQAMSLVHETLYQADDLARIELGAYLRNLANEVFRSNASAARNIALEVEVANVPVGMERAIQIGLVVNELLSNALKHAFVGKAAGVVRVHASHAEGRGIIVRVEDDGRGMPDPQTHVARGVGLRLVEALVRQMKGAIEWQTTGGTVATLKVPDELVRPA